jgi:LysR family transcriptional regulator, glycine cleavage system transcriptional activator
MIETRCKVSNVPLEPLRTFRAAARLLSFAGAARELGVTPAAVSQTLSKLERSLGVALFQRGARQVTLSAAGAQFYVAVEPALRGIDEAAQRLAPDQGAAVRVTAPPTWTSLWLMPRLQDFTLRFPNVRVEVDANTRVTDLEGEHFSLGIRYGESLAGHFKRAALFDQRFVPVCSPSVASGLATLDDLSKAKLLHESDTTRWQHWLEEALGADAHRAGQLWDGGSGLYFSHGTLAVQAALRGLGVALTEPSFVVDELARGALVQPFTHCGAARHRYHAVWSARLPLSTSSQSFLDWLKAKARETARALSLR